MKSSRFLLSGILGGILVIACTKDNAGNETHTSVTVDGSGSGASAPSSISTGDTTLSDGVPTMATTTLPGPATTTDTASTGEACTLDCEDMPAGEVIECDNWAPDCPEGQKCAAYIPAGSNSFDASKCVEVTGTGEPGDKCTSKGGATGSDSCVKGAMCWYYDMDQVGTCIALCTGTPAVPICEAGSRCAVSGALNLCIPDCDPLLQDCPGFGHACYADSEGGFSCVLDLSGDEGQANDPCALNCDFDCSCDAGLMCATAAFVGMGCEAMDPPGCCTPFCTFPDGSCPNADQGCVQYFDPKQLPVDDPRLDIGLCGLPP